jgi:hypothetical protein
MEIRSCASYGRPSMTALAWKRRRSAHHAVAFMLGEEVPVLALGTALLTGLFGTNLAHLLPQTDTKQRDAAHLSA